MESQQRGQLLPKVVASLQTSSGEDSRVDKPLRSNHADAEAPRTLRKPLQTELSLSTQDPCKASTTLWVQQRGWRRGHSLPPRASLNDNQLVPAGDQGMTSGAQVLGLLLATNQTVNVGPPALPLTQEQQLPGSVLGGKRDGLREPQAHPTLQLLGQRCKTLSALGIPDLPRAPS